MAGPGLPETSLAHLRILIRWFRQQTGEAAQAKKAGAFHASSPCQRVWQNEPG